MALAFDAVGPSAAGQTATTPTSLTWAHTCTGSQRALLVFVAVGQNSGSDATKTISGVTYAGASMTQIGSPVHANNGTAGYVACYGLIAPATGANNVVVTFTSAPSVAEAGSLSFTGAGQTTAFGTPVTGFGNTATATVTVAANTSGNLIAFGVCAGNNTGTNPTSPATKRVQANFSFSSAGGCFGAATIPATGSSVTAAWPITTDWWGELAVEVLAASSGNNTAAGLAAETDTALAAGRARATSTGTALETDTALPAGRSHTTPTGLAAEVDTGLAAGRTRATTTGLSAETDTALPAGRIRATSTGLAAETDVGVPASSPGGHSTATGVAAETDTALAAGRVRATGTAAALETDTALAAGRTRATTTGRGAETDTALPAGRTRATTTGTGTETDTARDAGRARATPTGTAAETDSALDAGDPNAIILDLHLAGRVDPDRWRAVAESDRWRAATELAPWRVAVDLDPRIADTEPNRLRIEVEA